MKKHFLTGLALLLPVVLTLAIVVFLVNLLTDPFVNAIEGVINYNSVNHPSWNINQSTGLLLIIRLLILGMIFLFILLIGFLTRSFFMYSMMRMADQMIHRIPFINRIYKSIQDVIQTLFSSKSTTFKQVVLVPYPNEGSVCLGFITSDTTHDSNNLKIRDKVPVFIAGAFNPTFGFIFMFPRDQVTYIDMKVDEAFKVLVSCGIMLPSVQGKIDDPNP